MAEKRANSGRTGRPPLSERRKAATRVEIAQEAVRLFTAKGVAATSGEEIAAASGVSTRTLWRYFATKEQCVRPLLTVALDIMAQVLRRWPAERPLRDAIGGEGWPQAHDPGDSRTLRDLVRLTGNEPGLRAVWLEVHFAAEAVFAEILAERSRAPQPDPLALKVQAVMLNGALRVAVEDWAWRADESSELSGDESVRRALRLAASNLPL